MLLMHAGDARADRGFVVSAGGDALVAIPEAQDSVESPPQTDPAFGYFGRLSWETAVPSYTRAERGYRWAFGIDPDVEFSRSRQVGGGASSTIAAGLRLSAAFSQRRMGLLEVSARGGFYLALRGGLELNNEDEGMAGVHPLAASSQSRMRPAAQADVLSDVSFGEFFLLGESGLRIEMEFSMLMAEPAADSRETGYGIRMRGGLGAYF
jgi:hypothetical protein